MVVLFVQIFSLECLGECFDRLFLFGYVGAIDVGGALVVVVWWLGSVKWCWKLRIHSQNHRQVGLFSIKLGCWLHQLSLGIVLNESGLG